jgi:osmotically-inducible protein OsmY
MRFRSVSLASLASLALPLFTACQGQTSRTQTTAATLEAGSTAASKDRVDQLVSDAIGDRVAATGAMDGETNDLGWSVDKGVVTLRGAVPSALAKQRIHDACAQIPGVSHVVDAALVVLHTRSSPNDDQEIERSLRDRLRARSDDEVEVRASGGKVTITGTVPTLVERSEIERLVVRTPNVAALDDEIRERPLSKP